MPELSEPAGYDPAGRTVAWASFYDEARERFTEAGLDNPELNARRIVEEASGYEGGEFHLGLRELATKRGVARFDELVGRRLEGEPLQYVVGSWGFRDLDLLVDSRVLIPRPETEVVAGVALDELATKTAGPDRLLAADLGTGSGAIGLSIAFEFPRAEVLLTDNSTAALQVARANLAGLGRAGTRVSIAHGDWFDAIPAEQRGQFDLVVSNPPYVSPDYELPHEVVRWEPTEALVAPNGGRAHIETLLSGVGSWLKPGGSVVLEIGWDQGPWATEVAIEAGFLAADVLPDLAGRDRVLRCRWPS
ncbi:MAG: peptide chain release factor N(5)-glutamine methyltransferase [Acidimicrobiales bacterium]